MKSPCRTTVSIFVALVGVMSSGCGAAASDSRALRDTYSIVVYTPFEDTCRSGVVTEAGTGSITVQTVSALVVSGTFDVTLNTGEHVSGAFSAPVSERIGPDLPAAFGVHH